MNIAIVRRNGYGDLLCTIPLVKWLKLTYPQCHITLFHDQSNKDLLPFLNEFDHTHVFPSGNKYLSILSTALKFRQQHFDKLIIAKTSPMKLMNYFAAVLNAQRSYAYTDNSWHSRFITNPQPYIQEKAVQSHQALKCLKLMAPKTDYLEPFLYPKIQLSDPKDREIQQFLVRGLEKNTGKRVFISLDYNRQDSNPGLQLYLSTLNIVAKKKNLHIILASRFDKTSEVQTLRTHLTCPVTFFNTQTVREFLNLLDCCDFCFIGDGGIMHMSAALGKPQLVLFGSTKISEWKPLSQKAICLYHPETVKKIPTEEITAKLIENL